MRKQPGTRRAPLHPYRVALAGGWGDHNFVNFLADGYVVVVQVQPTVTFHDRCGICSSTRQILLQKYPEGIPDNIDKYELASELYYWENSRKVPIGGSQDAWGSVYPGINLLHYDFRHHNGVLPKTVTSIINQRTARWFERNFWIVDCVGPRPHGYNPFDGGRFATRKVVEQLGKSGQDCFAAIKNQDVEAWEPRSTSARPPGERCCPLFSSIQPSPYPCCRGSVTTNASMRAPCLQVAASGISTWRRRNPLTVDFR